MRKKIKMHTSFYLKDHRYEKTKESVKFLIKLLTKYKSKKNYKLIDVLDIIKKQFCIRVF